MNKSVRKNKTLINPLSWKMLLYQDMHNCYSFHVTMKVKHPMLYCISLSKQPNAHPDNRVASSTCAAYV